MMKDNTKHTSKRRLRFASDNDNSVEQQQNEHSNGEQESRHEPLVLTDETCRQLWYQADEISHFKDSIRELVFYGQSQNGDDDMSGLQRYRIERAQHKRNVIQYILKVHRKIGIKNAAFLDKASRHSSAWAKSVARHQAYQDFCSVYEKPSPLLLSAETGVGVKRKTEERGSPSVVCGRRVRQRQISNTSPMIHTA